MLGAVIGDIVGSIYEFHNYKGKDFPLFTEYNYFTDDTVMTTAVAEAILNAGKYYADVRDRAVESMVKFGQVYPDAGYGGNFFEWIFGDHQPYGSYGNGAAMRVSPCAYAAISLEQAQFLAEQVTIVSHNHSEGIKGAQAVVTAIYLAKEGNDKEYIRKYIEDNYYRLDFTLDEIRDSYQFDVSCQGSVPQAIEAFLESESFEDAVRNAVSIGGDSDTIAAITGSIAEAYYGIPNQLKFQAASYLDTNLLSVINTFEDKYPLDK